MASHILKKTSPLFLFWSCVNAQITLPTVTGCVGNPAGTATFSTVLSVSTGSERIVAGDFWNQLGAVWILSTDTEGIELSQPGIPGYGAGFGGGGPPAAAESALILDPSKTAWTLSVPTSSLGGEWDIDFEASTPTASSAAGSAQPSSAAGASSAAASSAPIASSSSSDPTTSTPLPTVAKRYEPARPSRFGADEVQAPKTTNVVVLPNRPQRPMPVGAKFRRQTDTGQFHLIITGSLPCLGPSVSQTVSDNPTIASQCENNDISTNAAAWTTYGVLLPHVLHSLQV